MSVNVSEEMKILTAFSTQRVRDKYQSAFEAYPYSQYVLDNLPAFMAFDLIRTTMTMDTHHAVPVANAGDFILSSLASAFRWLVKSKCDLDSIKLLVNDFSRYKAEPKESFVLKFAGMCFDGPPDLAPRILFHQLARFELSRLEKVMNNRDKFDSLVRNLFSGIAAKDREAFIDKINTKTPEQLAEGLRNWRDLRTELLGTQANVALA